MRHLDRLSTFSTTRLSMKTNLRSCELYLTVHVGITSLNKEVLKDPDFTNNLVEVLPRFRQEEVAVMGDIEGMFHQVWVSPKHRDALRFLW